MWYTDAGRFSCYSRWVRVWMYLNPHEQVVSKPKSSDDKCFNMTLVIVTTSWLSICFGLVPLYSLLFIPRWKMVCVTENTKIMNMITHDQLSSVLTGKLSMRSALTLCFVQRMLTETQKLPHSRKWRHYSHNIHPIISCIIPLWNIETPLHCTRKDSFMKCI